MKVFIFDDNLLILSAAKSLLRNLPAEIVTYEQSNRHQLDPTEVSRSLYVIDLQMPRESGYDLIQRLQTVDPGVCYIVHSATSTVSATSNLMRSGALAVIEKPAEPHELITAVESGIERVAQRVTALENVAAIRSAIESLSNKERETAFACAISPDNKRVAERMGCSVRTVEGHRNAINSKLGRDGARDLYSNLADYQIQAAALALPPLDSAVEPTA